ncbi:cysteine synthase family protein [Peribacillus simplex]|uniref:PLP-dependent cysteine synthase family protein n=1 Tax=Peribacillus TaxID=2675229 RepID=UPI000F63F26E|nr:MULTISPECIES: cysteine synthase family protein [Peribacillus]MDF1999855.1 cysteine synthase family protein [Peribacillus frigoritolerans]RRN69528.1 cysteine synthase family protein [Peribacillus simplex]
MVRKSIIDRIGETPIISLRLDEDSKAHVYAKLEMQNPFGMKDRVAKNMIMKALQSGRLKIGDPIVESSSGTLALGVALVGTYLGHEVHIITDPRIDELTHKKLKALGAHVHIVDKMGNEGGWQQARLEYLDRFLAEHPTAFWPCQYENPDNPLAYEGLAADLTNEIGKIDFLVGGVGSGGSLCGAAHALKKWNPHLKVIAVDAVGSSIFEQSDIPKRLQGGLGNSLKPKNVDYSIIDDVHWLNDEEAFAWTLELARHEKIFAGNSSGSVYAVGRWLSKQVSPDQNIACIFPDRGDRYVNTIYDESYCREHILQTAYLNLAPERHESIIDVKTWSYVQYDRGRLAREKTTVC